MYLQLYFLLKKKKKTPKKKAFQTERFSQKFLMLYSKMRPICVCYLQLLLPIIYVLIAVINLKPMCKV